MKIISDNPKVLDELFNQLSKRNNVEKIKDSKDDGGMLGGLETLYLELLPCFVSVIHIYEFLKKNFPNMKMEFKPLGKPTVGMNIERYETLSEKAKEKIHSEFEIVIKNK